MTEQTQRILIGSFGWQHEGWQGSYYPADLPPEWRLGYYSNEFPLAVVTDRERALEADLPAEMAGCREDLWALVVVSAPEAEQAASLDLLSQLPRAGGVLLQLDPAQADPTTWLAQIEARFDGWPLCVDPASLLSEAWRSALRERSIGWSWNPDSDADGLSVGPLAVIRMGGESSPRQLRDSIEAGLAVNRPERHVALVIEGEPPNMETLRQAKLIEELM